MSDTDVEEKLNTENISSVDVQSCPAEKLSRLPMSRIKTIVKTVPSVALVNAEALAALGFLCEQFIQDFCGSVFELTVQNGKKTISKLHVQNTVKLVQKYEFLEGIID
ncbi:unnamed protein product [Heterobilharzia americana]|nr:unnamed protein product [Heterobilharzia americana]CAH8526058.1 unnamed protein product [Heterobilharzia americana]